MTRQCDSPCKRDLLILHQGALGDFILTIPALFALKREYPRIDAICQSKLGKLAEYLNIIDESFPLEAAAAASLYADTIDTGMQERLNAYDTIILFSFSRELEHNIKNHAQKPVYRVAPRPVPEKQIHVTKHLFSALIEKGLLAADMKLSELRYKDQRYPVHVPRKIMVHPGSGSPVKNWPLPNFLKLLEHLTSKGFFPEIILGPAEEEVVEDLKFSKYPVHILSDLLKLADLLKSAGGYIGNDSGVTHLSAYLGVPTVAIFGPSNPLRWQPVGKTVGVVTSDVDCDPCFETHPDSCKTSDCLNSISFQKVINEFLRVYSH